MTTPQEILMRAITADEAGRILEAQSLYQDGIEKLMQLLETVEERRRNAFYERIKEYLERAEQIKDRVSKCMEQGELEKHIPIDDDSIGNSYNKLFGAYLNNQIKEILIEEPYLYERYQFNNLIVFLELAVKKCPNLKYIRLVTKTHQRGAEAQRTNIEQITSDLQNRKITLRLVFEDTLHDRKIILSNGYIIKIGRGLHFFKPTPTPLALGLTDYDFRKCLQTDVDIWRTKHFKK